VPNAGWPFAVVGRNRQRDRSGPPSRKARISSRPRYRSGSGGIEYRASSASMATIASTSPACQASLQRLQRGDER
jgi:hypothetical protein